MRKKRQGKIGGNGQSPDDLSDILPEVEKAFNVELEKAGKFIDLLDWDLAGKELYELLKNDNDTKFVILFS